LTLFSNSWNQNNEMIKINLLHLNNINTLCQMFMLYLIFAYTWVDYLNFQGSIQLS